MFNQKKRRRRKKKEGQNFFFIKCSYRKVKKKKLKFIGFEE